MAGRKILALLTVVRIHLREIICTKRLFNKLVEGSFQLAEEVRAIEIKVRENLFQFLIVILQLVSEKQSV